MSIEDAAWRAYNEEQEQMREDRSTPNPRVTSPADHAATVRDVQATFVTRSMPDDEWRDYMIREYNALADRWEALAERATEAEREVTRSESKRHEATIRQQQAEARATELERERDEYRAANEAVRVCAVHTRDLVDGNDCLVCSVEDANSRAERAEAALREIVEIKESGMGSSGWGIDFYEIARAALGETASAEGQA